MTLRDSAGTPGIESVSEVCAPVAPGEAEVKERRQKTSGIYAAYLRETRFEDLPREARDMAKDLILDSVGCALGATQTPDARGFIELAKQFAGADGVSTVIGSGVRISPARAAMVNTHLANLLDFDDTYDIYSPGHPGCLIIPSALAIGEAVNASGRDVLAAVEVGYELVARVGRAMGSLLWLTGQPKLAELIGPAVITARLLGLDEAAVLRTFDVLSLDLLTLSSDPSAPPTQQKWDVPAGMKLGSLKGNNGHGSELGIMAAYKAKSGLTGMKGLLDADHAGWYAAGQPAEGFQFLTRGLGREHWILDMSFKPTPSCRWTHPPITAAWAALEHRPVRAEDIERVVVKGVKRLERYECERMLDAQFSIPFALALAITGETPGPAWYTSGRFRDPDIRDLAAKVQLVRDPEAEAREISDVRMTCTVEITFKNGEVKVGRCEHVKGAPKNPMTRDELVAKFRVNASHSTAELQDAIVVRLLALEDLPKIGELMALLRTAGTDGQRAKGAGV